MIYATVKTEFIDFLENYQIIINSKVTCDEKRTISKSGIGQQRTFIDSQAYIDIN